jgi:tRNA pseudouridine38-40 synthase
MARIKLIVSYHGGSYLGWQKTKEGPSIEETLEKALERLTLKRPPLEAASRTDRGVHARGQVVSFETDFPAAKLARALNALLPSSIFVQSAEEVSLQFHPTLDAKGKEYHYELTFTLLPFFLETAWHVYRPLDLALLNQEAATLIGTHNFRAFENASDPKEAVCTLWKFEAIPTEYGLRFVLEGDRFLYKMVRNLVGTAVDRGTGKQERSMREVLRSEDRRNAGVTAPAHGLFLHRVWYVL